MSQAPSVISRVSAIFNMFSDEKPLLTIEEIAATLEVSPASAYRYVSELTHAGMLTRSSGCYRIGPKIIQLEYLVRRYDPVIQVGLELMNTLSDITGCSVLLCNVYDQTIVNVVHVVGSNPVQLTYTRGMPMPLFRGSQAHVILAHTDRRKLKRIFEASLNNPALAPDVKAIGADWQAFTKALRQIRSRGYYISRSELNSGVDGIAAPVFGESEEILGSLVLGINTASPPAMDEAMLIKLVTQNAIEISNRIRQIHVKS